MKDLKFPYKKVLIVYTFMNNRLIDIDNFIYGMKAVQDALSDIRIIKEPQFDGSCLVISSDLLKKGVNIPHCKIGHLLDDTSMMLSC